MGRTGIGGNLGSGKTLLAMLLCLSDSLKGLKIYSNMWLSFGELISPSALIDFELENCTVLLDEAETIMDSRVNKEASRYITYFGLQTRKRKVNVVYTSQLLDAIDKRFRFITNTFILADDRQEDSEEDFNYMIYRGNKCKPMYIKYIDTVKYHKMYDTSKIIYPSEFLTETDTNINELLKLVTELPTKKSYVSYVKTLVPFVSDDDISSVRFIKS